MQPSVRRVCMSVCACACVQDMEVRRVAHLARFNALMLARFALSLTSLKVCACMCLRVRVFYQQLGRDRGRTPPPRHADC